MTPRPAILNIFARSPIKPLVQHMQETMRCVELLEDYFVACFEARWDTAKTLQVQISEHEMKADEIKRDIRLHLPDSIMLPVPRTDLLDLLSQQEHIANAAEDIAGITLGRQMVFPSSLHEQLKAFLQCSVAVCAQAARVIQELDELLESGFRGKEAKLVAAMVEELNQIEDDSDNLQIDVRGALFALEKDLPPVDVMFMYKVVDYIGSMADYAEKVGSRLLMLLAK